MNKAVFLDRDGTLNIDPGYVRKIEDFELYPNVIKALKLLKNFQLFIITNQSGIGRGYYTEKDFHKFNNHLIAELRKEGINIKETFYCPHHPDEECDCRKPSTRFIKEAAKKYGLDLKKSFVIGDHPHDIEMGHKAGIKTIYMLTGHGEKHKKDQKHKPDLVTYDILEAAKWIIKMDKD